MSNLIVSHGIMLLLLSACAASKELPPPQKPKTEPASRTPAASASASVADCAGYECTAVGAKRMLREAAASSGAELKGAAAIEFEHLVEQATARMCQTDLSPASFARARQNLVRIIANTPYGMESALARHIEAIRYGRSNLCPLWPFC